MVYKVSCSCGKEYIGETKRALGTCISINEHQSPTRGGETEKSAIAKHPAWEKTSVIEQPKSVDILRI